MINITTNQNLLIEAEKHTGNILTRSLKYNSAKNKINASQKQMEKDIFNKVINPFYKKALDYKNKMDAKTEEVDKMKDSFRAKELKKMMRDQFREFQVKQLRDLNNAIDRLMALYEKKINNFITDKSLLGAIITEKGQLALQTLWVVLSTASKQKFWKKLEDDALGWTDEVKAQISAAIEKLEVEAKKAEEQRKKEEEGLEEKAYTIDVVEEYFKKQNPPIEFQKEYSYTKESYTNYIVFNREGDNLSIQSYQKNASGEKINVKNTTPKEIQTVFLVVEKIRKETNAPELDDLLDYLDDKDVKLDTYYYLNDSKTDKLRFLKRKEELFVIALKTNPNSTSEKKVKTKEDIDKIIALVSDDIEEQSSESSSEISDEERTTGGYEE
jgi:hypothetical protein